MKELLLYNLNSSKGQQIKQLCTLLKIKFRSVQPEEYLEPVGALAGIKGIEPTGTPFTGASFTDEMLIFVNFDDPSLHQFLTRYRQEGIIKVELKAGLTPHNILWNSIQLRNELKSEHDELEKTAGR